MQNSYENDWLYNLVHHKKPDNKEVAFYQKQIAIYGQPVLELGSGTGNFLVTYSDEVSDESKEQNESNLINADLRNFDLQQKFNLIFAAGNSLQHLHTLTDLESCFASVKKHLKRGSKFIVEVYNPLLKFLISEPNKRLFVRNVDTIDGIVEISENVFYDSAAQILHIKRHYKNRFMSEERTVEFTMRQFFPQEFDYLFLKNGFRIEQKFGGFDESKFTRESPKQIVVASLK